MQNNNLGQTSKKFRQRVVATQEKLQKAKEAERKLLTRIKIELGGLVTKAGFADEDRAVILGALLRAKKAMEENPEKWREDFRRIGIAAFAKTAATPPVQESPNVPNGTLGGLKIDFSTTSPDLIAAIREISNRQA